MSISEDAACLLLDNTLKTAGNKEQDGYESPTIANFLLFFKRPGILNPIL